MHPTLRYRQLRLELIDMVFSAAFSPSPTEPQPPADLYGQVRPMLELCSLWGLLKRLHILDPNHTLYERVAMWEVIARAANQVRPEVVEAVAESFEDDEEFLQLAQEANEAFGPPMEYAANSQVLHYKSASLIRSLSLEDGADPEARDNERRVASGVNVIEFVDAIQRSRQGCSTFAMDWTKLKAVAREFDKLIEAELASS